MAFTQNLIAPCGINCGVCLAYLREKNRCCGCLVEGGQKANHCANCRIKLCEEHENIGGLCFSCKKFPCTRMKNIDKRYVLKYHLSLIQNLKDIEDMGLPAFLANEEQKWRCPHCGATLCVHRKACPVCQKPYREGAHDPF